MLCVASSGIASLLLLGGRTAHSTFHIPLELYPGKPCAIKKGSDLAALIKKVDLIIWDEVPMQDHLCQEAVDLSFKDIRDNYDQPFGGRTVVFGGDFQQILPVIVKGRREESVGQCLRASRLWNDIEILFLTENKHLDNSDREEREFAEWLLNVGCEQNSKEGCVHLPETMKCGETIQSLVQTIHPGVGTMDPELDNDQYFMERTILAAQNDEVDEVNELVLNPLPGQETNFHSSDSVQYEGGLMEIFNIQLNVSTQSKCQACLCQTSSSKRVHL